MSDELEKRVKILQEEVIKHKRINEEMKETYEKQNKLKRRNNRQIEKKKMIQLKSISLIIKNQF